MVWKTLGLKFKLGTAQSRAGPTGPTGHPSVEFIYHNMQPGQYGVSGVLCAVLLPLWHHCWQVLVCRWQEWPLSWRSGRWYCSARLLVKLYISSRPDGPGSRFNSITIAHISFVTSAVRHCSRGGHQCALYCIKSSLQTSDRWHCHPAGVSSARLDLLATPEAGVCQIKALGTSGRHWTVRAVPRGCCHIAGSVRVILLTGSYVSGRVGLAGERWLYTVSEH